MAISLWELQSNLSLKDAASSKKELHKAVQTIYKKKQILVWSIT